MPLPAQTILPKLSHPQLENFNKQQQHLIPIVEGEVAEPEPSLEEQLAAEYKRGFAEADTQVAEKAAAELETVRSAHQAEMDALRSCLMDELAGQMAAQIEQGFQTLEDRLSRSAASVLGEVVEDGIRAQMLEAFDKTLRKLLENETATNIAVSGPEILLDPLKDKLGGVGERLVFKPNDAAELKVKVCDTQIETRFTEWMAQLRQMREDQ
ncbi:hypothetical protein JM93_00449 [Roseibium hamelinense]|uniref:Flagellar assembly protein FliH n=1 Tax=Roseibium hamelinense TaxID=150831 RepID=A0A562TGY4_9HYPH|nr:hypothetical protein [Roseibium hamelinense]MTI45918.1 hypothetical protein [Roseibium hamelinense]TWI92897.1 hypothetical protein JM93_00449 [Roseibium hamelinense]